MGLKEHTIGFSMAKNKYLERVYNQFPLENDMSGKTYHFLSTSKDISGINWLKTLNNAEQQQQIFTIFVNMAEQINKYINTEEEFRIHMAINIFNRALLGFKSKK